MILANLSRVCRRLKGMKVLKIIIFKLKLPINLNAELRGNLMVVSQESYFCVIIPYHLFLSLLHSLPIVTIQIYFKNQTLVIK